MNGRPLPPRPEWPTPMLGPNASPLPVGSIIAFAGRLAPVDGAATDPHVTNAIEAWGWTLCDGRALEAGVYSELYACLGELYGGDGNGAFNLPDLRGYFLRGADPDAKVDVDAGATRKAADGSRGVGSLQGDALRNHVHLEVAGGIPAPLGQAMAPFGVGPQGPAIGGGDGAMPLSAAETRPKNVAVHYLIRFTNRLPRA